jgi:hypothetical protein
MVIRVSRPPVLRNVVGDIRFDACRPVDACRGTTRFWTASQRVGALTSSAYQYQPLMFFANGSKGVLLTMPCLAGETPVTSVV